MSPTNGARRTALITGASSGIGRAFAAIFAADGHDLVLTARRVAEMEALATELRARHGVAVTVIGADLADEAGARAVRTEVDARGFAVDTLVNAAGFGDLGAFVDSDLGRDLSMIRVNCVAVVALTRLFLPDIVARRGKVLNVASTAAFQPGPYMATYFASKAFVLSFSEALAEEVRGTGATVTVLCPGATATEFFDVAAMHDSGLVKGRRLPSAASVAEFGYRAMNAGKRVAIHGLVNQMLAFSVRFAPRRVAALLAETLVKPR